MEYSTSSHSQSSQSKQYSSSGKDLSKDSEKESLSQKGPEGYTTNRRKAIHVDDVYRAKEALEKIMNASPEEAPYTDEDGDAHWGEVIVSEDISLGDFQRWLNSNEGRLHRYIYEPKDDDESNKSEKGSSESSKKSSSQSSSSGSQYSSSVQAGSTVQAGGRNTQVGAAGSGIGVFGSGRVIVYSLPSFLHAEVASAVMMSITKQVVQIGKDVNLMDTISEAAPACRVGNRVQEPDQAIVPHGLEVGGDVKAAEPGHPYPNVLVKVSYKNDTLNQLRTTLRRWVASETSVQVAIGIKVFSRTSRRVAILHHRDVEPREVEFGKDANDSDLELTFPLGAIYFGLKKLPEKLQGHEDDKITIDLKEVRDRIEKVLENDPSTQK
ncbi:hypothetical protein THRCLA_21352 [Thraustotheca clavata]|uniref:Uncharacterized protein n=1 Tax=Thraustotheca clavata TaxID=74557 RepID=A0A1V9ZXI4_9STRA|nr:hypothetical protein THRCLA_21352 [Thraustotheca clavata]